MARSYSNGALEERERDRIEKLKSFDILDTPREQEFDAIVHLAQRLLGVPMAMISLVDDHRQWFKAKCGVGADGTAREDAFCAHAIHVERIMIVEDATCDPRFVDNPLVTGEMGLRFYAGVPLRPAAAGYAEDLSGVGTLCVLDTRPRTMSEDDIEVLRELAGLAAALIASRAMAGRARRHAEQLERQHLQLRQAERMAGIGSWRLDLADQSIHWSDHVYAIHGLPPGHMPTVDEALDFFPEDRRGRIGELLAHCAQHGESFDFESDFITADGRQRRVRSIGEPQVVDGQTVALLGVFQDITESHVREQTLRLSADTDGLTGLGNRAWFDAALERVVTEHQRQELPACLLLLDLDGFKGVNDTFGHAAGDEVLQIMAERLRRITPAQGFAARLGGDEFVVVLTRPRDCARVETIVSVLLSSMRHTVERDGERRAVSATIGAALLCADIAGPTDLLRRADLALYEAKRDRRGTGRVYGSSAVVAPFGTGGSARSHAA